MKIFDTSLKILFVNVHIGMINILSISNYIVEGKHKLLAKFINSQSVFTTAE